MTLRRRILSSLTLLLNVLLSAAQVSFIDQFHISHYDMEAGLPHSNVNGFFSDSRGFLWISTYGGGAVRYDGYTFERFRLAAPGQVVSNSCKQIAEDGFKRLWIAFDEGTAVLDMSTMRPVVPPCEARDFGRMLRRTTVRVYCDAKGCIWHVAGDSIFRYSFDREGRVAHIASCRYQRNVPDIAISDVDGNGTVWCSVDDGLFRLSAVGDRLERSEIAPAMSQLNGCYVTSLLKHDGHVWIATNRGVFAYHLLTRRLHHYHHTDSEQSLSHDHCTSLAVSPDGRVLVGTLRGLNVLNRQHDAFEHWSTSTRLRPMPSDFIHTLAVRDGQIWIGTETAGIVRLSPRPLMLFAHEHSTGRPTSLSPHPVNAMYAAPDGTLWAGTVEGGLNRRTGMDDFDHFTTHNSRLSHNSVSVIEPDAHGNLWIGTWGGGLNMVAPGTPSVIQHIEVEPPLRSPTSYIGSLAYDARHDALWLGCNEGVYLYDLKTRQIDIPFPGNDDIRGCIGSVIDSDGQLWLGCMTGVCVVDLRSGRDAEGHFAYRHLSSKLDHPESAVVDKISCFCQASDGTLWLGSNGYGLYRRQMDKATGKETFHCLTTDDGLANNSVKGIAEDNQGRLWITTSNGLSVYDPRARTFINYGTDEGLPCQRFYFNSAVKGADGIIYLGSVDGLIEVRGENNSSPTSPRLTFTRLTVDHQEVTAADGDMLDADISQARRIRLHESNRSMTIDFSSLTFDDDIYGHYSYRMKGFDDEWIPLKAGEHSVRYTGLRPGSYTFEVRYTSEADGKHDSAISIDVDVAPYFWRSWWFSLLVLLLIAAGGWWFYRWRMTIWRQRETEKLMAPIVKLLNETDTPPDQLQSRIQTIVEGQIRLRDSFHRTVEEDRQQVAKQHQKSLMEQASDVMEKHYMDSEFGIAEFADAMGMSRSLLSKRLHAEAGVSTGQFIRQYRLNVARHLIMEHPVDRNITEIAYRVGFNDPKYFTRCFTRYYGYSPSAYREGDSTAE